MTRKNLLFVAGCGLLFMAACQSPKDQIVRKWQVDSFEIPDRDSMMKVQEKSIDTITVVDSNMAMYVGTSNVDSFKAIVKKRMNEQREEQNKRAKEVTMNFTKNGALVQEAMGKADTTAYYTLAADNKSITLKPKNPMPGMPEEKPQVWKIEKISSSELHFKIDQDGHAIFIHLKPADEKKAEAKK